MRLAAELTQKQLAERIGTAQTVIVRLESPKNRSIPNLATVEKIADACGREVEISFPVKKQ